MAAAINQRGVRALLRHCMLINTSGRSVVSMTHPDRDGETRR